MLSLVLTSIALGLAGFDPLGLAALVAAMALGARRAGVAALLLATLLSTITFALVPALVLGPSIDRLGHWAGRLGHGVWGPLVLVVGLGLLVWGLLGLRRSGRGEHHEDQRAPRSTGPVGMAFTGVLVGLSAFIDPAFYGMVVVAAQQPGVLRTVVVVMVWVLCSHSALVVVGLATLLGLYRPVHALIERVRRRWGRMLARAGWIALVVVALVCVVEGIAEWRSHWLLP